MSIIKHIKFKHDILILSTRHLCSICNLCILSKPSEHPCFANVPPLAKSSALFRTTADGHPLLIPSSRRRRRRKTEGHRQLTSPLGGELQVDADQSLAQPVRDSPIIAEGKSFLSIPEPASSARSHNGPDIQDPETCQKLYRRNRRRAVREIIGTIVNGVKSPKTLTQHFANVLARGKTHNSIYQQTDDSRVEVIEHEFSSSEVARSLRSSENTAPGPDRLIYHHWRSLDPSAQVLTRIFNVCLHHQMVPPEWKESTTILLPKEGDPDIPNNWWPIALSNTLYKLFMKCVAQRFKEWLLRYDVLSSSQKSSCPMTVSSNTIFFLHKRFEDARTMKRDLCLAWLDVTNALVPFHIAQLMMLSVLPRLVTHF
ncbi:retrovirus-related Pol polyprotein from type-1 retrotransposable element R2 [Caerostris extrusa]|uniref:Retrovirus-related Pol polyprotein from type-1 retrotransposable element R2 n=1 Tax=Caerostris extrusa TaxID=172846 RepID=A0AAV4X4U6_CAEEX|nr:retrovirus-related Pol polyprotein from type-1 retrotransposable element R2 [Caerostris extrusa]